MNKQPAFACDLDGTLCNVEHRRHWVTSRPKNWAAWNAGIADDKPHQPVLLAITALSQSHKIVLVSGRGDDYRSQTVAWLERYNVPYDALFMRTAGDFRPDDEIKDELVTEVEKTYQIVGAFDDRLRVVKMWRNRGIFVFDCAQGGGDF